MWMTCSRQTVWEAYVHNSPLCRSNVTTALYPQTFPPFSLGEVSLLRIALTVVLGSAGQILNAGVYKALGKWADGIW